MSIGIDQIEKPSIALCLSGGGLRATLFHLGLVRALRQTVIDGKPAITRVDEIYSVSGGSILAAHLVANWERYCGTDEQFESVEEEIRKLALSNIRGRVLQRWLLSCMAVVPRLTGMSRTYWLAKEYERLYGKVHLSSFYRDGGLSRPSLYVLTTSFKTGELCSFSPHGFEIARRPDKGTGHSPVEVRADLIPLPFAVAASSAFPPLFPPIELTKQMLGDVDNIDFERSVYLSDGGVFDNLGVEKFLYNKAVGKSNANVVILSNAGSSFKSDAENSFSGVFSRNVRASDIMMRRIAESTDDKILGMTGVALVDVRIKKTVAGTILRETTQQRMQKVRTDLDRFPPMLVEMLVEHGYQVGRHALTLKGFNAAEGEKAPPVLLSDANKLDREAREAAKRSIWSINPRDWSTYVLAIILESIMILFFSGIGSYFIARFDAENEEKAKNQEKEARLAASDQYKDRVESLQRENADLRRRLEKYDLSAQPIALRNKDYKVWIQFAGTITREEMIQLGAAIKRKWPQTPGASRGGERTKAAAGYNEVRYGPQADETAARNLANDINSIGNFPPVKVEQSTLISPGSLEIWLSR